MRPLLIVALAAAVVAAVLLGVGRPAAARGDTAVPDSVTTVGHGVVTLVPDTATVNAGVHAQSASAADALAQTSKEMNAVIAALKDAGGTNLQTQEVSLYPQTGQDGKVTGYAADDNVSASSPIAKAGALVDAAVAAGANSVNGPSLSVSDRDAAYRDALAKAVDDAKQKADAIGKAGGFAVGAVSTVAEQSDMPQPIFHAAAMPAAASTTIEPGTQDITADVTVTFRLT